jgi:hypothetical protein
MPVVAMPVDIVVHALQFVVGENKFFFEGGVMFIPYMALHWSLLVYAYLSVFVRFFPSAWNQYFRILRLALLVNDSVYRRTLRVKRTFMNRFVHFGVASVVLCCVYIHLETTYNIIVLSTTIIGYVIAIALGLSTVVLTYGRLFVGLD